MAPFGQLYSSYPNNLRVSRILAVAALNDLEVTLVPGFDFAAQMNPHGDFRKKFPQGKVPAFETSDGFRIAESLAITMFVASSGPKADQLLGGTPSDLRSRAVVMSWISFADQELGANGVTPIGGMCKFKYIAPNQTVYDKALQETERSLATLEIGLKERKEAGGSGRFLVGEQVTLADIMVYGMLWYGWSTVIDEALRSKCPAVVEYFEGLWEVKEIRDAFKEVHSCKERLTLDSPGVSITSK